MITRQATVDIDEENHLAYVCLQPDRKGESGTVFTTIKFEQFDNRYWQGRHWPAIKIDQDEDGRIFGIELIGFKL